FVLPSVTSSHTYTRSSGLFRIYFFHDTATTEIYTLSLHDTLPISHVDEPHECGVHPAPEIARDGTYRGADGGGHEHRHGRHRGRDRKSTRLNSSHDQISYAVFCLKKKKKSKNLLYTASIASVRIIL